MGGCCSRDAPPISFSGNVTLVAQRLEKTVRRKEHWRAVVNSESRDFPVSVAGYRCNVWICMSDKGAQDCDRKIVVLNLS